MTARYAREVEVLESAAETLEEHPEYDPGQFLRKFAAALREHTHEPA